MPVPTPGGDINVWGAGLNAFLANFADTATGQLLDSATGKVNFNLQTGSAYTLVNADVGRVVSMNNGGANTITVPTDAAMSGGAAPIGAQIHFRQAGTGQTVFAASAGVTIVARGLTTIHLAGQYAYATATKVAANTWEISGDLA